MLKFSPPGGMYGDILIFWDWKSDLELFYINFWIRCIICEILVTIIINVPLCVLISRILEKNLNLLESMVYIKTTCVQVNHPAVCRSFATMSWFKRMCRSCGHPKDHIIHVFQGKLKLMWNSTYIPHLSSTL